MLQRTDDSRERAYAESSARFRKRTGKRRPDFETMRQLVANKALSMEDLRQYLYVTRERVRQIVNEFFLEERPHEGRDTHRGRHFQALMREKRRASRRARYRAFEARCKIYRDVRRHCAHTGRTIATVWRHKRPAERSYRVNGKMWYVLRITSAHRAKGSDRLYAKTNGFDKDKLASHDVLCVLVELERPIRVSNMYLVSAKTFLDTDLRYVLIPVDGFGQKHCGGPCARIDWQGHLVSSL